MNRTHLQNTILGVAAAASITFTSLQPANAQCISGLGATSAQLATQTWPAAFTGADYTSIPASGLPSSLSPTFDFQKVTSVTADSNGVYVLDVGSSRPQVKQLELSGSQLRSLFYYNVEHGTPTGLLSVDGILWATEPGGYVEALAQCVAHEGAGCSASNYSGSLFLGAAVHGANVTGANFDGTYIWFATSNGYLVKVQAPVITTYPNGNFESVTPPVLIGAVQASRQSLGTVVFDGRFIWTYTANSLIEFDPQTNNVVSTYPISSTALSLVFDGTYFWIGTENGAVKFDPSESAFVNQSQIDAGALFFDGSSVTIFGRDGEMVKARACDGTILWKAMLAPPVQEAFDGSRHWIVYGNNTVSVR